MRVVTDSETLSGTEATNVESHLNQALKDMASYSEPTQTFLILFELPSKLTT